MKNFNVEQVVKELLNNISELTKEPKVLIIDKWIQSFNGNLYYQKDDGHYVAYINGVLQYLHVDVWTYHNGKPFEGYEIHHKDFIKSNNEIDNLQMLTKSEHMKLHALARNSKEYNCVYCGKKFSSKGFAKVHFCSSKCQYLYHHEDRTCVVCGKTFSVYKYSPTKTCSLACGVKLRNRNKAGQFI